MKIIKEKLKDESKINKVKKVIDKASNVKKRKPILQRSEASEHISEFDLNEVGKEKVKLNDLVKTLKKSGTQAFVKNQLKDAAKLKSLSLPLSKPKLEEINRTIIYEKVCDEVSRWDPIVNSNRKADQIIFPLKKPDYKLETFENVSKRFVTKSKLEEEISNILNKSQNVMTNKKELTPAEEKALEAMSLKEAKLRHDNIIKQKMLQSYEEAKARRQKRIKSKRYHRMLKREKMKKMLKEFEELKQNDKNAALQKLIEANMDTDKLRIMERMTLKHRNTGKWAKKQKLRAKYNPEIRSILKEDLELGRNLKQKSSIDNLKVKLSIDNLRENLKAPSESAVFDLNHEKKKETTGLIEDEIPHNKFMADIIKDIEEEKETLNEEKEEILNEEKEETLNEEKEEILNEEIRDSPHQVEMLADHLLANLSTSISDIEKIKEISPPPEENEASKGLELDFSNDVKVLQSCEFNLMTLGDDIDDAQEHTVTMKEAFSDEGMISEFREEKKAADEANKPQDIDSFLPGWGSWTGPGIKPSKAKKKRFLIKAADPTPRKNTLGNVIFNDEKDKKVAEHQVNSLPFPFTNPHQFESYIRQPIGHTWNPETSFKKFIAPRIITKMGKIIDPIDAEDVVMPKRVEKKVPKQFKKQKKKQSKPF